MVFSGCSAERTNIISKTFHNTAARYNAYFIAREKIREVEQAVLTGHQHNYNEILKVYPVVDSAVIDGVETQLQDILQKASIAVQRHKNSKWVDDSYILIGKARYYNAEFVEAIETFKFVNTKSDDNDARHAALVALMRTFIDYEEDNNANAVSDFLKKEALNKENLKDLYLTRAYYYETKEDYENVRLNLELAMPLLKKKDGKAKYHFLLGQIYQKQENDALAFENFEECLKSNPEYELSFYARLNMYQAFELSKNNEADKIRKHYLKLLRDGKNVDYKDKIYYEMAGFELKQENIDKAIDHYKSSVKVSNSNPRQKAFSYLQLGKIHFDTLKEYALAKSYYDSSVQNMPQEEAIYASTKERQEVLTDFVQQVQTIQLQDSLLKLADMDSSSLSAFFDQIIAERMEAEKEIEKVAQRQNSQNAVFNNTEETGFNQENTEGAIWYFYNQNAVSIGQNEFRRIWGDRPLEDNWRRADNENNTNMVAEAPSGTPEGAPTDTAQAVSEVDQATINEAIKAEMFASVPFNAEEKHIALEAIENAYYNLGNIYNFGLNEKPDAVSSYETVLERFPETEYKPELYYLLYLINKDLDLAKSETYKEKVLNQFPNTSYARIIQNPNYSEESNAANEKIRQIYKKAYALYQAANYENAQNLINEAKIGYPETDFIDNLRLLEILMIGATENQFNYQFALSNFLKSYQDSELVPYAQKLLTASEGLAKKITDQRGADYIEYFEQPHFLVVVYEPNQALEEEIPKILDQFNKNSFKEWELKTGNLIFDGSKSMVLISEFEDRKQAMEYLEQINIANSPLKGFDSEKLDKFVISKDNFQIFYQSKDLDNYLSFFKEFY